MHSIGFLAYKKKKKSREFHQHPGSFFFLWITFFMSGINFQIWRKEDGKYFQISQTK